MKKQANNLFLPLRLILAIAAGVGLAAAAWHFESFDWKNFGILCGIFLVSIGVCFLPRPLPKPVAAIIALLAPAGMFFLTETYSHTVIGNMQFDAIRFNLYFYYILALVLFLAIGRASIALRIEALLMALIGIADYFVILFRSNPIQPWDFLSLRTAVSVADNYTYSVTWLFSQLTMAYVLLFLLLGTTASLDLNKIRSSRSKKWIAPAVRVLGICALAGAFLGWVKFIQDPGLKDRTSLDQTLFTPKVMLRKNGTVVNFTMNLRFMQVDKPAGYTTEAAKALLAQQETTADVPEELPNVIVIMNECFSDPAVLGEFETNVSYLDHVSALLDGAENTVSGYAYASVLGGNTADTEFEFLTGNSMAFLPFGSIPYQQYYFSDILSVTDQFESLGYYSMAMHPYNSTGWNRNKIYKQMHFDNMMFISQYTNVVRLRQYVNDASNYENVLRVYNSTTDPVFIFNVTMQNHGGFGTAYDNFTPEVQALFQNTKSNKYLNNYLSLIKIADEAIGELLDTLSQSEKPTVVVFFGDHQPNDWVVEPIYREYGLDIENQTIEQNQRREMVPFFIWANYDIEERKDMRISINYLNSLLFEVTGLPTSGYQAFRQKLYEEFPVINSVGVIDKDGNAFPITEGTAEQQKLLKQYQMLQYYDMFDKK